MSTTTFVPTIPSLTTQGAKTKLTRAFTDDSAEQEFWNFYNRFKEEDSTGTTWAVSQWPQAKFEEAPLLTSNTDLAKYEVVTIDSGNSSGDNWKYTYFPQVRVGLFIDESPL